MFCTGLNTSIPVFVLFFRKGSSFNLQKNADKRKTKQRVIVFIENKFGGITMTNPNHLKISYQTTRATLQWRNK
jgi:endonuclease V-like protein UPF0215 family